MLVVGPTSSGKTTWLKHLVFGRHEYFAAPPETMLLFYKKPQKAYEYMEDDMNRDKRSNTRFPSFRKFKSIPNSIEELKDILETYLRQMPKLVVFDDYLDDVGQILKHFFTVLTHHYNCFTVFLCQNLFDKKGNLRTLSMNTQYMVLFNNPQDRSVVAHLAKQIFPGRVGILNKAYRKAVNSRSHVSVLCHVWANHHLKRNAIYDKVIQHRDRPNGLKNLHNPDVLIFLLQIKREVAFPNVLDILTVAIFYFS